MSSRRSLILVGAIVVGIFAGVALLNYVRGIEDDIAAEKQSVPVYVATEDIPAGTPAAEAQEFLMKQPARIRKLAAFGKRKKEKTPPVKESFSWIFGREVEGYFN